MQCTVITPGSTEVSSNTGSSLKQGGHWFVFIQWKKLCSDSGLLFQFSLNGPFKKCILQCSNRSLKMIFERYGIPDIIVLDNGPQHGSDEFCKLLWHGPTTKVHHFFTRNNTSILSFLYFTTEVYYSVYPSQ